MTEKGRIEHLGVPLELRNYRPGRDYLAVRQNLIEGEIYWEEWDSQEGIERRFRRSPDSIVVAAFGDRIVGSVFLSDELYPYIYRLAVRTDFRGRGIGEQLMDEAIRRLKLHGHKEAAIFVDENKEELKEWYKRRGFQEGGLYRSMWKEIE
ncbi:MAG: Acetyltransferase, GNAT family [Candidatus Levybacteria bacterium GW2011_GWA2_40_8]|nr:MAG: Acetyltransferase, GNAT family [Candidatus Levybacteria bacterium GW2011_GWA2_40_8]